MTATGIPHRTGGIGSAGSAGGRSPRRFAGRRLVRLHLLSRRIPMTLAALAGCGVALAIVITVHWTGGSGALPRLSSLIEAATAALVVVATRNPFGESERITGPWLPGLRLGAAFGLTVAAFGALATGSAMGTLPGGELALLRNLTGMIGIGLICAPVLGAALAWIGPLGYLSVVEYALGASWQSPWTWPARPADDLGAAVCAGLVFAVGTLLITILGPREIVGEQL